MNIGRPKRIIEVDPVSQPIPETLPDPAQEPGLEPSQPAEPGR